MASLTRSHNDPPSGWALRLVEMLLLSGVLLAIFIPRVEVSTIHFDEINWIATSNVFEPFIAGDRTSAAFGESYWTLTAPPATRYVIAIGRTIGGYGPDRLNAQADFGVSADKLAAANAMPPDGLLWWSRIPMVVLATVACLMSFWLMRCLFGAVAAYVGLALLAFSPWLGATMVRAMAETPLLCVLLLVIVASGELAVLADRCSSLRRQLLWLAIAGFGAGLAGSLKLSGLTALAGVVVVWLCAVALRQRARPAFQRIVLAAAGIALLVAVAAATLVAFNPYLDPDPLGRFFKLVGFRAGEMQGQLQLKPAWGVAGLGDRLRFIFEYVFEQAVMLRHPAAGVAALAFWLVGFGSVMSRSYLSLRRRIVDPAGAAMVVALTAAGPMLATPLKWDRYLFLPVWFSALLIALGITLCARRLFNAAAKRNGWRIGAGLGSPSDGAQPGS